MLFIFFLINTIKQTNKRNFKMNSITNINEKTQRSECEPVFCGERNHIINYKGTLYCKEYPFDRILNPGTDTGPVNCNNCRVFGSWNGVHVMDCCNCVRWELEEQGKYHISVTEKAI